MGRAKKENAASAAAAAIPSAAAESSGSSRLVRALYLAVLAAIANYAMLCQQGAPPTSRWVWKVAPIGVMAVLAHCLGGFNTKYVFRIVCGLACSALGDAFLELEELPALAKRPRAAAEAQWLFIYGLAALLCGHLFYIFAFAANRFRIRKPAAIGLNLYALVVFMLLRPHLPPELVAPVGTYASIIGWMAILAVSRRPELGLTAPADLAAQRFSWRCGAAGALSFAISDTVLAVNKFVLPVDHAKAVIMTTYYLGQLGIAASATGAPEAAAAAATRAVAKKNK